MASTLLQDAIGLQISMIPRQEPRHGESHYPDNRLI